MSVCLCLSIILFDFVKFYIIVLSERELFAVANMANKHH